MLVGRNAREARRARRPSTASPTVTTDLDAALAEDARPIYFDAQVTSERKKAILQGRSRPGKHIYTEKPIAESVDEGLELVEAAARRRHHQRRRARQALPARADEAEAADRLRLLRPDPLGARRVRLLGLRGRPAARPAAELELPRRGRRRHRPRHVLPLELRAREPLRRRRGRDGQGRHPHPGALGRAGRALRRHRRRRRVRRSSSSTAASSRRSTRPGRCGSTARSSSSSRSTARTAPPSPACSAAASSPASARPSRCGTPTCRPTEDFRGQWERGPGQPGVRQRVPRAVGAVPPRRRRRPAARLRLRGRGARPAAGRGRRCSRRAEGGGSELP